MRMERQKLKHNVARPICDWSVRSVSSLTRLLLSLRCTMFDIILSYYCDLVPLQDRDWSEYWRLLFKKVTLDDIQAFEKTYKGSEEEAESLKSAYLDCEGDMERIIEEVIFKHCTCTCIAR